METLTIDRDTMTIDFGEIVAPIPFRLLFGACPVDPELVEVCGPTARWDQPELDDVLNARCGSF